jgi:hypothetical protein
VKQIVGIQHQIYNWRIKMWKVDVAGARFHTGRPESWCVKYSVCKVSTTLPKRKPFVSLSLSLRHLPSFVLVSIKIITISNKNFCF